MPTGVISERLDYHDNAWDPVLFVQDRSQKFCDTFGIDKYWLGSNERVTYFWEGDREEFTNDGVLTTHPWDEPVHRGRWQFKQRVLHQLTLNED